MDDLAAAPAPTPDPQPPASGDVEAIAALLDPPVKRAAYSDRKAWIMAVMSQLAYLPFEGPPGRREITEIAEAIAGSSDTAAIVRQLEALVTPRGGDGQARAELETRLGKLRFDLIDTFSVSVPLSSDSQAFIARVKSEFRQDGVNDYLVVAFRGTEPRKLADIRTDLRAELIKAPGVEGMNAKVHEGFYRALNDAPSGGLSIRERIDAAIQTPGHEGLPVFVTGHSLGGALAVVATRYIANGSRGACYTFGQPRVGNQDFNEQIFTPVYRVVNAADIVPAVPMGEVLTGVTIDFLDSLPIPLLDKLVALLKKIEKYRHGGDQRFLFPSEAVRKPGEMVRYPGLKVINNPGLIDRWGSSLHRIVGSWGGVALGDHAITLYVEKLAAHALARRALRRQLNTPSMKPPAAAPPSEPAAAAEAPEPPETPEPA